MGGTDMQAYEIHLRGAPCARKQCRMTLRQLCQLVVSVKSALRLCYHGACVAVQAGLWSREAVCSAPAPCHICPGGSHAEAVTSGIGGSHGKALLQDAWPAFLVCRKVEDAAGSIDFSAHATMWGLDEWSGGPDAACNSMPPDDRLQPLCHVRCSAASCVKCGSSNLSSTSVSCGFRDTVLATCCNSPGLTWLHVGSNS
jgi:hypothetical protein